MTTQIYHLLPSTWDTNIHQFFIESIGANPGLVYILSLCADVFVILYPIYLIYIYLVWHINHENNYKKLWLQVFLWVVWVFLINITMQYFVRKDRPSFLEGINLIFEHVPNNSFPSDHMAVWLVFGLIIYLSKMAYKADYVNNKVIKMTWLIFIVFGFVMWICRIAVWVHWFSDICGGIFVWWLVSLLIYRLDEYLDPYIYQPIIRLQEWVFDKLYIDKLLWIDNKTKNSE